MILSKLLKMNTSNIVFTIIKQFGTGVIVSTAYVHVRPNPVNIKDSH